MIATSAGSPRAAVPRSDKPLCVYAIVRGASPATAVRTADGDRLRAICRGPIAAIVRPVTRTPAPTRANLRRYDRTMRTLAGRFDALLPARFGTCVTAEELQFILSSRRSAFVRALARVRRRVQMTVRIVEQGKRNSTGGETTHRHGVLSGVDYLRMKASEAAVPEFEPMRAAVRRWVRAERIERRAGVATIYHLIPRASAGAYRAALERASAADGLHMVVSIGVTVSGPWPPYAFGSD